jgi:TPR repeat protein
VYVTNRSYLLEKVEQGAAYAQATLGDYLWKGQAVSSDIEEAYYWYIRAIPQLEGVAIYLGDKAVNERIRLAEEELDPQRVSDIQRAVSSRQGPPINAAQ